MYIVQKISHCDSPNADKSGYVYMRSNDINLAYRKCEMLNDEASAKKLHSGTCENGTCEYAVFEEPSV